MTGFTTEQVHAGQQPDATTGARVAPIHMSAGFVLDDLAEAKARFEGTSEGFSYTRVDNPTNRGAERTLAALERGADAIVVASGQAATATTILALAGGGGHVVASASLYEGTRELLRETLSWLGVTVDFLAVDDLDGWASAIRPTTRLLFAESIPNPKGDVPDLDALAEIAHAAGVPLVVDNTLATPYLLRPIEHGADIVVHSTSKLLAGHGSAIGGVIVDAGTFDYASHRERFPQLADDSTGESLVDVHGNGAFSVLARTTRMRFGAVASPFNSFLLQQGVETLSLRVERQSSTALAVAEWLEGQDAVRRVDYAGLASNPHAAVAARLLPRGAGVVLAVTLEGGQPAAEALIGALGLITHMTHIGDVRTLVLHPASTTHSLLDDEQLAAVGVTRGTLRLSIGLEDLADIVADLELGLAAASAVVDTGDGRQEAA